MNMSKFRDIQAIMPSPVSSVFIITEPFFPHYYIIHLCKKIVTGYCSLRSQQHKNFTLLEILQESVASPFQSVIILDVCNYLIIKEISAEQLSDIELHTRIRILRDWYSYLRNDVPGKRKINV